MSRVLAVLIRLDALEERLDAKRKAAPGQLDLFGSGAGPGGGEKCGNSWIDPNKTCRIGQGGPIDTSQPFSKYTMERIVSGIEARAFTTQGSRHDGTDLALALQKLAESPGLMGEHAREVMAFMDEVRAIAVIRQTNEIATKLEVDESKGPPAWSTQLSPEENMRDLLDWERPRYEAAERGRNWAKRAGIWGDEFLDALINDKTPHSQGLAAMIKEARDGTELDGQPSRAVKRRKELYEQWTEQLRQYNAAKGTNNEHGHYMETMRKYDQMRNEGAYLFGGQYMFGRVKGAITESLASHNTGGHYWPGGNVYWKVSMAGRGGAALYPNEVDPGNIQARIGQVIGLPKGAYDRPYNFSTTVHLTESERALTTHVHELGHMVHDTRSREIRNLVSTGQDSVAFYADSMTRAPAEIHQLLRQEGGPTPYGNVNMAEMFAESFVGYVMAPDEMRQNKPELYRWVADYLKKARENAVASRLAKTYTYG